MNSLLVSISTLVKEYCWRKMSHKFFNECIFTIIMRLLKTCKYLLQDFNKK